MCGIVGIFETRTVDAICAESLRRMNETPAAPRARRRRLLRRARHRTWPPAAVDHRSVDRPSAAVQRGRAASSSCSTVKSTTTRNSFPSCWRSVTCSGRRATRKSSCTRGKRGANPASRGSAACSPSRCGTGTSRPSFSRVTVSGVKPLFYALLPDGRLIFGSELKSLVAHGAFAHEFDPHAIEEYFCARLCAGTAHHLQERRQARARALAVVAPRRADGGAAPSTGMCDSR